LETVPSIRLRDNEPFEVALRRFKKSIEKEGVLSEVKKREAYEKPSVKKKKKGDRSEKEGGKDSAHVPEWIVSSGTGFCCPCSAKKDAMGIREQIDADIKAA